jgi:ATP-binding cassette subfamily B protein
MDNITFVFQNTRLFKATLLENIKYSRPSATIEDVEAAIDMAQCREIIEKLPEGLQTKIGSEGTYLSGGEQQRIILARAILKNAPIIILDEATAFTDQRMNT